MYFPSQPQTLLQNFHGVRNAGADRAAERLSPQYPFLPKAGTGASARATEVVSSSWGLFMAASRPPPPKPYQKQGWARNLQLPAPCPDSLGRDIIITKQLTTHRTLGHHGLPSFREAESLALEPGKAITCYSIQSPKTPSSQWVLSAPIVTGRV